MLGTELLREYIKARGLNNQQAAQAMRISPSFLHYWLKGARPSAPHQKTISRWSKGAVPLSAWEVKVDKATGTEG
jgi:Helix-turn-helix